MRSAGRPSCRRCSPRWAQCSRSRAWVTRSAHSRRRYIPLDQPFDAVVAYCIGMALFTIMMGNAFAAFPGDDGGHRPAAHRAQIRRQSRHHGLDRHAGRILRHAGDADGRQFQHRARGAARASRSQRGDQGADRRPRSCFWSPTSCSCICWSSVSEGTCRVTDAHRGTRLAICRASRSAMSTREFPNKLDHVLSGPHDARTAARAASRSFSAASTGIPPCTAIGFWRVSIAASRILPRPDAIRALLDAQFTGEKVAGECRYLARPRRAVSSGPMAGLGR